MIKRIARELDIPAQNQIVRGYEAKTQALRSAAHAYDYRADAYEDVSNIEGAQQREAYARNKKITQTLRSEFIVALDAEILQNQNEIKAETERTNSLKEARNALNQDIDAAISKEVQRLTKGFDKSNHWYDAFERNLTHKLHEQMSID